MQGRKDWYIAGIAALVACCAPLAVWLAARTFLPSVLVVAPLAILVAVGALGVVVARMFKRSEGRGRARATLFTVLLLALAGGVLVILFVAAMTLWLLWLFVVHGHQLAD